MQVFLDPERIGRTAAEIEAPAQLPDRVRKFGHLPDLNVWRPGDLLLFSALEPNDIQKEIGETQRRLEYADEDARWHHAAVYVGDGYLCEARPGWISPVARVRRVVDYVGRHRIRVLRDEQLLESSPDAGFRIAIAALKRLDRPYSIGTVIGQWLDSFSPDPVEHGVRAPKRGMVCSQLFYEAYLEVADRRPMRSTIAEARLPLPAALSASDRLDDEKKVAWARLA